VTTGTAVTFTVVSGDDVVVIVAGVALAAVAPAAATVITEIQMFSLLTVWRILSWKKYINNVVELNFA